MMRIRTPWNWRLIVLPLIALALALILWARDGRGETISTKLKDGSVRLCEGKPEYPVMSFCVVLTIDRR